MTTVLMRMRYHPLATANPANPATPANAAGPLELPLQTGQALTLLADASTRALWVHEGSVWLTQSCGRRAARQCAGALPPDVVLSAGQSHTLPAGSEWVLEAWPAARASVVQAAQAVHAGAGFGSRLEAVLGFRRAAAGPQPGAPARFKPGVLAASWLSRWRQRRQRAGAAAHWA